MRVFKFEILKCLKNKFFLSLFIIFIIINGLLFYYDCQTRIIKPYQYKELHHEIMSQSVDEAADQIQELQATYNFFSQYQIAPDTTVVLEQYTASKGETWVSKHLKDFKKVDDFDVHAQQELLKRANIEIQNVVSYSHYRTNMIEQAKKSQEISIFKDEKNSNLHNKVLKAYSQLDQDLALTLAPSLGIENWLTFSLPNVTCIILIVYLIGLMIFQERKRGFTLFTETMYKGKKTQYFAKLCTLITIVSAWFIMTQIVCGVITYLLYSLPPADTVIQSIPLFMKSIINGNILLLILIFLMYNIIFITIISSFAYLLAKYIWSYPVFLFIITCLFAISYYGYYNIPELNNFVILKYINIYAFMQPILFLGNYICFNFLIIPISIQQGFLFISILMIILIVGFANRKSLRLQSKKKTVFIQRKMKAHSLLYFECKKVWIKNFGLLLCISLLFIQCLLLMNTKSNITLDDIYYNNYLDTIGNQVSESATSKIKVIEDEYTSLQQNTSDINDYKMTDMWRRYSAFLKYQKNYSELSERTYGVLLKENEYILLFEDNTINRCAFLFVMVAVTLSIVACFYREKESGVDKIQLLSLKGREFLWRNKMLAILSLIIPFTICLYGMILLKNQQFYPVTQAYHEVQNLTFLKEFTIPLTIQSYFIFTMLFRIIVIIFIIFIMSFLSKHVKNRYTLLIVIISVSMICFAVAQMTHSVLWNPLYCLLQISLIPNIVHSTLLLLVLILIGIVCYKKGSRK